MEILFLNNNNLIGILLRNNVLILDIIFGIHVGTIPSVVGSLTNLVYLYLHANSLVGMTIA